MVHVAGVTYLANMAPIHTISTSLGGYHPDTPAPPHLNTM